MSDLVTGLEKTTLYIPPGAAPSEVTPLDPDDRRLRCPWGTSTSDYVAYHDHEWGMATDDEAVLFERLSLEGFQAGLSWLTILRKRTAFREAFADFDPPTVADYGGDDVTRLLGDAGIVRHRGKIEAVIGNARALLAMWERGTGLAELIWSFEPNRSDGSSRLHDIPAKTSQSEAMSTALRKVGFRFVGPTTCYAAMQATGVVNDHLVGCWARERCEASRTHLTLSG